MNSKTFLLQLISSSIILSVGIISCASSEKPLDPELFIKQPEPVAIGDIEYGVVSYYAEKFHNRRTANGEVYDMYGISGAHQTLPLNSIVKITNLENNKVLEVRINDRGPFLKNRIFDCSYGAAVKLGFVGKGTAIIKIEVLKIGDNLYKKE